MDAVLFITFVICLILFKYNKVEEESAIDSVVVEDTTREAKLNETYYKDENAFSEIINALGFPR